MIKFTYALTVGALVFSSVAMAEKTPHHSNGPFDPAIANEARLIDMLKRSGKISSQATVVEAEAALKIYMRQRLSASQGMAQDLSDSAVQLLSGSSNSALHRNQLLSKKKNAAGINHKWTPDPVQLETYTGPKRTARILTILMEYPDFPHNSIQESETDMYYADYNRQHYQDLLFSKNGYAGPNGEHLISMLNYYEAQSGNSYSVEGTVAGWYMAEHPAAYYGGKSPSGGNDINARALIREALLAAAADPKVNLSDFDLEDRYDLDGDGDLWEPDGLIDHVQIFIHQWVKKPVVVS